MTFLYKADPVRGAEWARLFAQKVPDLPFHIWPEVGDPLAVRYLAAPLRVRPSASRRIGVLGLGVLGKAVIDRLQNFGFACAAWSRSKHELEGIDCYAGAENLPAFLARTDILVCLLPLTDTTRGMLDCKLFDALPTGTGLDNCRIAVRHKMPRQGQIRNPWQIRPALSQAPATGPQLT